MFRRNTNKNKKILFLNISRNQKISNHNANKSVKNWKIKLASLKKHLQSKVIDLLKAKSRAKIKNKIYFP